MVVLNGRVGTGLRGELEDTRADNVGAWARGQVGGHGEGRRHRAMMDHELITQLYATLGDERVGRHDSLAVRSKALT